ncbi:MAG: antiterminator LoaP [Clostridiales bacterium]|nr:antiterminator LoaP [Clostridiales bacterium]
MKEPYNWYVMYVRSNTEGSVVDALNHAFAKVCDGYEYDAFCPESEQYYRDKQARLQGKLYKKRPLFPGYVFFETNMPEDLFRKLVFDVINKSHDIIRLLSYGDRKDVALRKEERERLEYLLKGKRCLEHSVGYIEGDKIIVTGGPLIGMEGNIVKINRHNRIAEIEIPMFGQKQIIKLALEIVSKS